MGTFAVHIAKSFGSEVTDVCSTRNVDLVRSIGADHVIDYTREDFTREERYDLILDCIANHSLTVFRQILNPKSSYIMVGAVGWHDCWLVGLLMRLIKALVLSWFVSQKLIMVGAKASQEDLATLHDLVRASVLPTTSRKSALFAALPSKSVTENSHHSYSIQRAARTT